MTENISILMQSISLHKLLLSKKKSEENILKAGSHSNDYEGFWAFLCDEGYLGILGALKVVKPKDVPRGTIFPQMILAQMVICPVIGILSKTALDDYDSCGTFCRQNLDGKRVFMTKFLKYALR